MADTTTTPTFTGGMSKIGSNFSSLTDAEKVAVYKSTSNNTDITVSDLALISPFIARVYYEE